MPLQNQRVLQADVTNNRDDLALISNMKVDANLQWRSNTLKWCYPSFSLLFTLVWVRHVCARVCAFVCARVRLQLDNQLREDTCCMEWLTFSQSPPAIKNELRSPLIAGPLKNQELVNSARVTLLEFCCALTNLLLFCLISMRFPA